MTSLIKIRILPVVLAALCAHAVPARGDITTPIVAQTGSHGGDPYGNGMVSLTNGSGIAKAVTADPSTWTFNGSAYQDEWMANYLTGAGNSKVAWAAFDLGTAKSLTKLWLFNTNYGGGPSGVEQYNLYYAVAPAVPLPAQPGKGSYANTGLTPQGDYHFSSGGWTKFNTSSALIATATGIDSIDLGGMSARYLAVEILSNHGDTYQGGRVGFDEVAVTITPAFPSIIATSPADGATDAITSDALLATFSRNLTPGTGNITLQQPDRLD